MVTTLLHCKFRVKTFPLGEPGVTRYLYLIQRRNVVKLMYVYLEATFCSKKIKYFDMLISLFLTPLCSHPPSPSPSLPLPATSHPLLCSDKEDRIILLAHPLISKTLTICSAFFLFSLLFYFGCLSYYLAGLHIFWLLIFFQLYVNQIFSLSSTTLLCTWFVFYRLY